MKTETVEINGHKYYGQMDKRRRTLKLYRIAEPEDQRIVGEEYTDLIIQYLRQLRNDKTS